MTVFLFRCNIFRNNCVLHLIHCYGSRISIEPQIDDPNYPDQMFPLPTNTEYSDRIQILRYITVKFRDDYGFPK